MAAFVAKQMVGNKLNAVKVKVTEQHFSTYFLRKTVQTWLSVTHQERKQISVYLTGFVKIFYLASIIDCSF
ncbi:hypothetical protein WN51_01464 [Melipona quadrifasciata]|uniref:Uncharacterized protein n=1 Tax=Melipona quadrifasciata TaxID=166423 RepID=A0A0M8ZW74_9HYME|nr:hypothetical protein WN51_01464 [Melipona quadrifasciata]